MSNENAYRKSKQEFLNTSDLLYQRNEELTPIITEANKSFLSPYLRFNDDVIISLYPLNRIKVDTVDFYGY